MVSRLVIALLGHSFTSKEQVSFMAAVTICSEFGALDSILKGRDIILLTKVCLVKAMIFPVVMYGCESWTIKNAESKELMHSNYSAGEDS